MRTVIRENIYVFFISLTLVIGMVGIGCDSTTGAEGPQGEQGPAGPIGPAGEDGSQMYADDGEPGDDVGDTGDYYLNQNTGELYGPKEAGGWGNPIIVLMGDDGADGKDGSQIHSGNGAPDASLGAEGDFYLDKDSYELYGPKTSDGWGTPLNLKGADGNANVTRYIFPGHDFSVNSVVRLRPTGQNQLTGAWLVYLVNTFDDLLIGTGTVKYHVPGYGSADMFYKVDHNNSWLNGFNIKIEEVDIEETGGTGQEYSQIEIVQIESSDTIDNRKQKGTIIPDNLDVSDYEAVAEYYGFYNY